MAPRNDWYEGDPEGSNFKDTTTGGGGGNAFKGDSTSDTLEAGNELLSNTGGGGNGDGLPQPDVRSGGGTGGRNNQNQNQNSQTKTWNWTPDPNAARKAWEHAGRPNTPDINAWFKAAVEAGSYLQSGESSSETAYNKSGFSRAGAPDITGMRAWARQHGMSEDFDRWDEGQLMAWEKQRDPNCPPNTPYQAYDGSGCIEKPIDSNNPNAAGGSGGGGGGGGGGQGGGGGTGGSGSGSPEASVQNRPDYNPNTNYVTHRQIGSNYGPSAGPQTGGPEPAPDQAYAAYQAQRQDPVTQQRAFTINRDRANNQPGGTVIPSSVIWRTGM